MRILLQRVSEAQVVVSGEVVGEIGEGLLALVGLTHGDGQEDLELLAKKLVGLRIFEDDEGKMNLSLLDVGGSCLLVSQFTLYGNCRKGRRPSFVGAMEPEQAEAMFLRFVERVRDYDVQVETGRFGAMMEVSLCNQGPVTLMLESREGKLL